MTCLPDLSLLLRLPLLRRRSRLLELLRLLLELPELADLERLRLERLRLLLLSLELPEIQKNNSALTTDRGPGVVEARAVSVQLTSIDSSI